MPRRPAFVLGLSMYVRWRPSISLLSAPTPPTFSLACFVNALLAPLPYIYLPPSLLSNPANAYPVP
ncbi:hypothetical protein FA95DRAFT_1561894 [Auriscalpium vulgare]|uniref:Uncharacterized protein n=2 Tax=Auriscalpium vulgare TaxID=40419 RepID=A0ACB8RKQ5_9AGAM|nr:hypothetical protein FA95DRAFT_1561894 [Auriscalpium vulgare]